MQFRELIVIFESSKFRIHAHWSTTDNTIPRTQIVSATITNLETNDTSEFSESLFVS